MVVEKGTKLYSIVNFKCPRCHLGELFIVRNPYNLKKMLDMPAQCPVCNQDFKMEPGFYSGALWASYPIVVVLMIVFWALFDVLFSQSITTNFLVVSLVVLILQPIVMRVGRAIWINLFVKYHD
jgi:uncharacterized protein (DUF983 family)